MARPLLTDELWAIVAPLRPPIPPRPKGGRPRVPDRACLTGNLIVLKTGLPWDYLPQELGTSRPLRRLCCVGGEVDVGTVKVGSSQLVRRQGDAQLIIDHHTGVCESIQTYLLGRLRRRLAYRRRR